MRFGLVNTHAPKHVLHLANLGSNHLKSWLRASLPNPPPTSTLTSLQPHIGMKETLSECHCDSFGAQSYRGRGRERAPEATWLTLAVYGSYECYQMRSREVTWPRSLSKLVAEMKHAKSTGQPQPFFLHILWCLTSANLLWEVFLFLIDIQRKSQTRKQKINFSPKRWKNEKQLQSNDSKGRNRSPVPWLEEIRVYSDYIFRSHVSSGWGESPETNLQAKCTLWKISNTNRRKPSDGAETSSTESHKKIHCLQSCPEELNSSALNIISQDSVTACLSFFLFLPLAKQLL